MSKVNSLVPMKNPPFGSILVTISLLMAICCQAAAEFAASEPVAPTAPPLEESGVPDPYANETKEQRDARMHWWRNAKFGMFIHWGVYAVPAGTYDGKKIDGIGEWIMLRGKIPVSEYRAFAKEFNPVQYDPESWAKLAKQAGMRYMVITSKHHDGFALFPSEVTDWDIADATPYKKDLIGPLAEAARAEGLKFGLYYSQAQDWTHPGGAKSWIEEGGGWDEAHKGDMDEYIDTIAVPQVKEILSTYQPDILWWDTPRDMNQERAEKLIQHLRLVPGIINNNRLGGGFKGDTETPEQRIPATGFKDRDWEVCMTMNGTWGFKSYDDNWKPTRDLIRKLCDIVSKGGNFLLNVGPTKEGLIPQPSIDRLQEIGQWMEVNGESIYSTTASPFGKFTWGRCTAKVRPDGATLYLHVFDWPEDGKLNVPGFKNTPTSTVLLADGSTLNSEPYQDENWKGLVINVPSAAPDPNVSVIKLEIAGELVAEKSLSRQNKEGQVHLIAGMAHLHNRSYNSNDHLKLGGKGQQTHISNWTDHRSSVSWEMEIAQPGTFIVQAEIAAPENTMLNFGIKDDKNQTQAELAATGGPSDYQLVELGELTIAEAGEVELELAPVKDQWQPINLRTVMLSPKQ